MRRTCFTIDSKLNKLSAESPRRQSNESQKDQNHAHTDTQNDHGRNPKIKGVFCTIVAAGRAALVVALAGYQAKTSPAYCHNSQQQEWHRPLPLNATPTYSVLFQLARE